MVNHNHLRIEDHVIANLKDGPSTISLMADRIPKTTYYTVRQVMYDMQKRGILVLVGYEQRHQVFGLNPEKDAMSTIPYLDDLLTGNSLKAYDLLNMVGMEDTLQSVQAARSIPRHITNLMYRALVYKKSKTKVPVDDVLGNIRQQMQKDYMQLQNAANILEQILSHPKFWTEASLRDMASDKNFNDAEVEAANKFYTSDGADKPVFQSPLED